MRGVVSCVVLALSCSVWCQPLKLQGSEDFLELVEPLITEHERTMYRDLKSYADRDYFEAVFWFKRDPHPELPGNTYKRAYFERRDQASRFAEGSIAGTRSARGRIFLLNGEPSEVVQNRLQEGQAVRGYEEIWTYQELGLKFRFVLDLSEQTYRLDAPVGLDRRLEAARLSHIVDRAESYRLAPFSLALPNIGSTKDVENLTATDRYEIDFTVSYDYFQGGMNKTQIVVGMTFHDASKKGLEVNLTAFDPYDNKVVDFKQKLEPVNGAYENFFVVLEPDQYQMVMRIKDRDGRESVQREVVDVPLVGQAGTASSIILADQFEAIPLEGFFQPRLFVFDQRYVPVRNSFRNWRRSRLYILQEFYGTTAVPNLVFRVDDTDVKANLESQIVTANNLKTVHSLDIPTSIRKPRSVSVLREVGSAFTVDRVDFGASESNAISAADARFDWALPRNDQVISMDAVAIRPHRDDASVMRVLLNGRPVFETHSSPWRVDFPESALSISGQHVLEVELEDGLGLTRSSRTLIPLRADEQIKSRAVQVFFNAFNEDLEFVSDLDTDLLTVEVDGDPRKPLDVFKLDEPITYCFLVDCSFSMRDSYKSNLKALKQFINAIRPEDQGYFVSFSDNYFQHNRPTRSKGVLNAVADSIQLQRPNPKHADNIYDENTTYIYDATIAAIHTLLQYPGRKIVILVSDGIGVEGSFPINGMLSYARENEVVIYSLWVDNNPQLSEDETEFITKDMGKGERFARAIGLSRYFADKDARRQIIGTKIRHSSIHEGILKLVSEESGGFHYRVFKSDRSLIQSYVGDIEKAIQTQYGMILNLPVSEKMQHVFIRSSDERLSIRSKSEVKVRKTNPLGE